MNRYSNAIYRREVKRPNSYRSQLPRPERAEAPKASTISRKRTRGNAYER